jgi:CubicO group peptidase (beta-lactamase class C family)
MRLLSAATAMFAALIVGSAATAQAPSPALKAAPAAPSVQSSSPGHPLTQADLEAWLDGYLPYAMQRGDVAGAVVVVVKDGQVLLQKGYGYSDMAKKTPVDPARTIFRPGSISKLFTWTAVMQQVERGNINLDADVNTYIDYKIPPGPGGKPITVRNLMTHTPGFEEQLKELIVADHKDVRPLGEALKGRIPARIYPAGETPAYSNYGAALAGYIVERTSGMPFDDYVEKNIFAPLGMTRSTFRPALPAAWQADMSKGYKLASGPAKPYELLTLEPAGSMATTAPDMARFMIAHLQNGAYGNARILAPETARRMHTTVDPHLPPLNAMALGFYQNNTNGRPVISHGGDTQWFHSVVNLYIDDNVGVFISLNSAGKNFATMTIRDTLFREFSDRYLPGPAPQGQLDPTIALQHAKEMAGVYHNSRGYQTSLVSILGLLSPTKVVANPDGTISVSVYQDDPGRPKVWREISPYLWVEVGGKSRLAAKVFNGRMRFAFDDYPMMVFDKAPAAVSSAWLLPALLASLAALLVTVVLWPVTAIVRRRHGKTFPLEGRQAQAHRLVRIGAALSAAAIIAWVLTLTTMFGDLTLLSAKLDWVLMVLHLAGSAAVFAGLGLAVWNLLVVWSGQRGWFTKLWAVVLVGSTGVLTWLAVAFHLVGLSVRY